MSRQARDHARRLVGALEPSVRQDLAEDPFGALQRLGYTVRLRPERDIGGTCSVAASFQPGPPPTITVLQSRSPRRQHFSAEHELGHRLVAEDDDLHDLFAEMPGDDQKFEEDVCDAIAAELLLPDTIVDRHIDEQGPTAQAVINLFHDRQASREACCVRAAQRIIGAGHVMLAKEGVAQFTATSDTPYRVRRQTPQPNDHPIMDAARRGSGRGEAPVRYASGGVSDRMFVDAVVDGDYVFAVFVDSKPPWIQGLSVMATATIDEWGNVTTADCPEASCPHCEVDFEAWGAPCPTCQAYFHHGLGGCGACACGTSASATASPVKTQLCAGDCFLRRPQSDFSNGSPVCNECLEI